MNEKKAAVLFSGGKDSTYACARAAEEGYGIECLITVLSKNPESYMLHTPNIEVTRLSAEAMGIPHFVGQTLGRKEEELLEIKKAIMNAKRKFGFDTLVTGALSSVYQKDRIEKIASDCGLGVFSPLWRVDQEMYLRDLVSRGYGFILTSVSAEGLDSSWLGREITLEEVEKLIFLSRKFRFNAAFEGGESETLVLDCPQFVNGKIKILKKEILWNGFTGVLRILDAILEKRSAR